MYNLKLIKKMMRYFLFINKIDICMASIEVHFNYLIFIIGQKHFNTLKNILYIKKSAIS